MPAQDREMTMLQYMIQMNATDGAACNFCLSREDLQRLRNAPLGRPFDLENYVAYRTAEQTLALSRRPAHAQAFVVCYLQLCRKMTEVEIEAAEPSGPH
jgi:hypothetical protein